MGTYPVVCAELCGLGHSTMRSTVRVVPRADFDKWLTDLRAKAGAGGGGGGGGEEAGGGGGGGDVAAQGKALFTEGAQPACGSCHTLEAAGTTAQTGPNLDEVLKGKDKAFIKESIEDPNKEIAQGFQPDIMPDNLRPIAGSEGPRDARELPSEETK